MHPYGNNVLLEKLKDTNMTGLVLPFSSRVPLSWGRVLQVGESVAKGSIDMGDKVLYISGAATNIANLPDVVVSESYIFAKEDRSC